MKKITILSVFLLLIITSSYAKDKISVVQKDSINELIVEIKDGENQPDLYIDGRKISFEILKLIDKNKIKSIDVIKGERALDEYNAKNGVILIHTITNEESLNITFRKGKNSSNVIIRSRSSDSSEKPLVIVDGTEKDEAFLKALNPNDISSVSIIKDSTAKIKYNAKGGVILVTTKDKKKKK